MKRVTILLGITLVGSGCVPQADLIHDPDWQDAYANVRAQKVKVTDTTFVVFDNPGAGRMSVWAWDPFSAPDSLPVSQFRLAAKTLFDLYQRRCTIDSVDWQGSEGKTLEPNSEGLVFEFFYHCAS